MPRTFVALDADFGSLNTIPQHVTLMGKCEACGSMREIDRDALENKAGVHVWLADAQKRMVCRECGAKKGKIVPGYYGVDH
ncbi:MAG TPA: hypothetical protein VGC14_02030 [Rhizobium sp.]